MRNCIKISFFIFLLLQGNSALSQTNSDDVSMNVLIDSLKTVLKSEKNELVQSKILNRLCLIYRNVGDNDSALYFGNEALRVSKNSLRKTNRKNNELLELKMEFGHAYGNVGSVYYYQSDFDKALYYFRNALSVARQLKDKKIIARRLGNMGNVYTSKSNYSLALNYYLRALKMDEELNNLEGISTWLGNIGIIYEEQGNYTKALEYHMRSLEASKELEQSPNKKLADLGKDGKAVDLGNIGNVYSNLKNFKKALEYYFVALTTDEELNNQNGIARHLGNIGAVYDQMAKENGISIAQRDSLGNKALDHYFLALKMQEKLENKIGIATNLANIGSLYTDQGKFDKAEIFLLRAIDISKTMGSQNSDMQFVELAARLYEKKREFKKAMRYFKMFYSIRDSLFNHDKNNELTRQELKYEFEKKEADLRLKQEKKQAVDLADKKRQFLFLVLIACVAFAVAIITVIVFRSLRIARKQKVIIEKQKHEVEEKQREVMDSIRYAKRIQIALLPQDKYIEKKMNQLNKKYIN
jgi:tetratricopeptide (TPR) repeat protein